MSSGLAALEVHHLTKSFRLHNDRSRSLKGLIAGGRRQRHERFTALSDVSFDVREGEVFGVIGHNGSGKSTLLKCMAGILQPNEGSVTIRRRMSALLELGAGFHPDLSGRENVYLNASILGMSRHDIAARFDEIVDFSGLANFIDSPVKVYSSGMYVRLAFAVAINVDPELLVIDEILAVGDVSFQQKCLEKFVDFRNEGRTIVLVTHAMDTVKDMCDRAVWLTGGKVTGEGDPSDLVEAYTEAMLGERIGGPDGSVRRGTGEVQIVSTQIFANGGTEPVKRFRTGDDVRVRMRYKTDRPLAAPVLTLEIEHLGGAVVSAPSMRDAGVVPEVLKGEGEIEVLFSNVSLLPGTYDLHTTFTDFNRSHVYDSLRVAARFDVMSGKPYEFGGVVTLRPQWTV